MRREARIARKLLPSALFDLYWTPDGPKDALFSIARKRACPLSSGERIMVLFTLAFWNDTSPVTLNDLFRLDYDNLRLCASLLLARAEGEAGIDRWLAESAPTPAPRGGR